MSQAEQEFKLATHAFIEKGDKILVTHRSSLEDFMPDCWDIPGGGIKFGENPPKSLTRETKEETGLDIEVRELIFCHNHVYDNQHWFALAYRCNIIGDETINLDLNEHDEYRWVTRQELQQLPNKIDFLEDFSQNYLQNNS